MKVIIDARTTQDEIMFNGVGRYSRLIIEKLITNYLDTQFHLIMYDNKSTLDDFLKSKHPNVRIERIGKYDESSTKKMIIHNLDIFFNFRLNKAIRKIKTKDSIFFSLFFLKGFSPLLIPTVLVIHDFALPVFNSYSTISPIHNILRFFFYWIKFFPIYFTKHVIVNAEYTVNDLLKYAPFLKKEKVTPILLGVYQEYKEVDAEFEKYLPKDYKDREYLIYLGGGLTKNKNSEGVIDGFKLFVEKLKDEGIKENNIPYLVIAGKNFTSQYSKSADAFHKYVNESGISKYVHYTGMYDDYARWPLLRNSFGYIHLSLYEGFGFGVAEAMLAKIPVIAHKGTTYPEVVKDGGILVDGRNKAEVADAIMRIYKDREFSKKISQKGYERAKQLDWNVTAKKTFKILKQTYDGINK